MSNRPWKTFADRESSVVIFQLTDHLAHSHHLYFTNPGWYDGGRKLLIASDRNNATNLYSVDLAGNGALTQVTEFDRHAGQADLHQVAVNPIRGEAYAWIGRELRALDLHTGRQRTLAEAPDGFRGLIPNVTADGLTVCTGLSETYPDEPVGFDERFRRRPVSRLLTVPTDGSRPATVIHEARCWIGHVNTSPTQPHLLTFCHEGPWTKVDNRIWCLDLRTGQTWKVRECTAPNECVGHEYWMADGIHLGYHGHAPGSDGALRPVFGSIRYDNTDRQESPCLAKSMHYHSLDREIIVGDGTRENPRLLLWQRADGYAQPRVLAYHGGSWRTQALHVHPRFSPDGRHVLYTADPAGYGNVYLAELPADLNQLPILKEKTK
jgi:oligogalacturonide lyase